MYYVLCSVHWYHLIGYYLLALVLVLDSLGSVLDYLGGSLECREPHETVQNNTKQVKECEQSMTRLSVGWLDNCFVGVHSGILGNPMEYQEILRNH